MEEKYVKDPAALLEETGLLFELNRQVLHPFGLSLVVGEGDAEDRGAFRLVDAQEDIEGVVYGDDAFMDGLEKLVDFLVEGGQRKLTQRKEELGYVVQEEANPYIKSTGIPLVTYNPEYDGEVADMPDLVTFFVPYEWAKKEIDSYFGLSIQSFLSEYIYDQSELIYDEAKKQGVLISEEPMWDAL